MIPWPGMMIPGIALRLIYSEVYSILFKLSVDGANNPNNNHLLSNCHSKMPTCLSLPDDRHTG